MPSDVDVTSIALWRHVDNLVGQPVPLLLNQLQMGEFEIKIGNISNIEPCTFSSALRNGSNGNVDRMQGFSAWDLNCPGSGRRIGISFSRLAPSYAASYVASAPDVGLVAIRVCTAAPNDLAAVLRMSGPPTLWVESSPSTATVSDGPVGRPFAVHQPARPAWPQAVAVASA
eukprot:CAMPEP_0113662682 /NCGR_PEP_ID=MMETSP0038_2-20120614/713_1 /TAXON_ID=2898 /ORGANISM="Cryptomonas paramecium" /LENGTH=171 /DNA_ID=CAMNT_0000577607 /DNA_START=149 /DNA_END=662 /DNA_ORIENTATION=+ /assembly_acc=CAM_ASM_000170